MGLCCATIKQHKDMGQPQATKPDQIQQQKIILSQLLFRIQGENLKKLLHRSIGALVWLNKNKQKVVGSGALISKNLILTAAHNVYNRITNQEYSGFKFYLGANGTAKDYIQVEQARYLEQYKECDSQFKLSNDFALLKLKKQVQYNQFLKLSLPCSECLKNNNQNTQLKVCGFPGQYQQSYKPKTLNGQQFTLYQYGLAKKDRIVVIDPQKCKIGYGISTLPGQSGCPVAIGQNIIAVHIGGGMASEEFNIARLADIAMFTTLQKWCQELKRDPYQIEDIHLCKHIDSTVKQYLSKSSINKIKRKNSIQQLKGPITNQSGSKKVTIPSVKLQPIQIDRSRLKQIHLQHKGLRQIDLRSQIYLGGLNLRRNKLSSINLSQNTNLISLNLNNNLISAIDITNNICLSYLDLSDNKIQSIDLKNNTNLTQLYLNSNQISIIDVSNNINLIRMNLGANALGTLNLSNNTNLTHLFLHNNKLSKIDVSHNTRLSILTLGLNELSEINLIHNANLSELAIPNNKIQSIILRFTHKLFSQKIYLSDQNSAYCQVQVFYNYKDFQECQKLVNKWINMYKNGEFNKKGCNYSFIASQQS